MSVWSLFVIGAGLALLVWLKRGRWVSLIATWVAVASLVAWGIPLRWPFGAHVKTGDRNAILLTEGYSKDSVNVFAHTYGRSFPVYDYGAYLPGGMDTLHVFGYGLTAGAWEGLPPAALVFHPAPLPVGITDVQWTREPGEGEALILRGYAHAPAHMRVVLSAFQTGLDSVELAGDTTFTLCTIPKAAGRVVYTLTLLDGKDTVERDPVPVLVRPPASWSVLILGSSPDFEQKFLQQWLEANGHKVALRTAITKGKYGQYFGNLPVGLASTLTFLDSVDILVADPASLAGLPDHIQALLRKRIQQQGMGLIVRADTGLAGVWGAGALPVEVTGDSVAAAVTLRIEGRDAGGTRAGSVTLASQFLQAPAYLSVREGARPLIADGHGHTWAGSVLTGSGKVVLTTLPSAYRWMLAGDTADYARYWSVLLREAAGPQVTQRVQIAPSMPEVGDPVRIDYTDESNVRPQVQTGGVRLALKRNPSIPFDWTGTFWPVRAGWQETNGSWWYVFGVKDWRGVRAAEQEADTKTRRETESRSTIQAAEAGDNESYYYFVVFMVAVGFLWAAKRVERRIK